jgi:hypothetical protein
MRLSDKKHVSERSQRFQFVYWVWGSECRSRKRGFTLAGEDGRIAIYRVPTG